jgi:hypothetical protein
MSTFTFYITRIAKAATTLTGVGLAAVVLASGAPALARPVGPGLDSMSVQCRAMQTQVGQLIGEYGDPSTSNARRGDILTQLREIGSDWIAIGCKAAFGSIAIVLPPVRGIPHAPITRGNNKVGPTPAMPGPLQPKGPPKGVILHHGNTPVLQ